VCRILLTRSIEPFSIVNELIPFAQLSENSREYQGHGWGCSWLDDGADWHHYHNLAPIWEDDLSQFMHTRLLLVHARSAFKDEGIIVENNMPFSDGESVFIFNGELRGVKIKSDGRIGAEKIFNYIRRFDKGDKLHALTLVSTTYNEDPEYFQMHRRVQNNIERVCSVPFAGESGWLPINNNSTTVI